MKITTILSLIHLIQGLFERDVGQPYGTTDTLCVQQPQCPLLHTEKQILWYKLGHLSFSLLLYV